MFPYLYFLDVDLLINKIIDQCYYLCSFIFLIYINLKMNYIYGKYKCKYYYYIQNISKYFFVILVIVDWFICQVSFNRRILIYVIFTYF